jgi:hypothetical protein
MAGPLAAVERFFERLFERPAARLFQSRVEPVQIQRALERAMESERRVHARRTYAPSTFRVLLNDRDAAALDGERRTLANDLGEALRLYARSHGYVLLAQPRVDIGSSSSVQQSDVRAFAEPVSTPELPAWPAQGGPPSRSDPLPPMAPAGATAVFAAPQVSPPRATLAIRSPQQETVRIPVRSGTMRIGRALDNDIVLADDKISRHHGQISTRMGMLVFTDVGSTNGSFLNGSAVTEIALGPGDVLQLGRSTVTIEPTP